MRHQMRLLWLCQRYGYVTDCYPVAIDIHVAAGSGPPALSPPCRRLEAVTQQVSATALHTQEHSSLGSRKGDEEKAQTKLGGK